MHANTISAVLMAALGLQLAALHSLQPAEAAPACPFSADAYALDLVLVLDGSATASSSDFRAQQDFVLALAARLDGTGSRIAVVQPPPPGSSSSPCASSAAACTAGLFSADLSSSTLAARVNALQPSGGSSLALQLQPTLNHALANILMPNFRANTRQVVAVLSGSRPLDAANLGSISITLQASGVLVFALPIGDDEDAPAFGLDSLASSPAQLIFVPTFSALTGPDAQNMFILEAACPGQTKRCQNWR